MQVYRPERFLKGSPDGPDTRHPFAELSFGAGPHKCIGYRYTWFLKDPAHVIICMQSNFIQ